MTFCSCLPGKHIKIFCMCKRDIATSINPGAFWIRVRGRSRPSTKIWHYDGTLGGLHDPQRTSTWGLNFLYTRPKASIYLWVLIIPLETGVNGGAQDKAKLDLDRTDFCTGISTDLSRLSSSAHTSWSARITSMSVWQVHGAYGQSVPHVVPPFSSCVCEICFTSYRHNVPFFGCL